MEMWKRTPEEQYNVVVAKILEAIQITDGKLSVCWSGGKDSTFLLYVFCSLWKDLYPDKKVVVTFADTTNELRDIYDFIKEFPKYLEEKFGVKIMLWDTRPKNKQTYITICKQIGIPLVSKRVAESVSIIRRYLKDLGLTYSDIEPYLEPNSENCKKLTELGFNKSALSIILGYDGKHNNFDSYAKLARRWHPLIYAPFEVTARCCFLLKKQPMHIIQKALKLQPMIGEMACESKLREEVYLKTGCNNFVDGKGKSKPMGSMTEQGLLENIYKLQIPVAKCYGDLIYEDGEYKYTKAERTGCALCGFGIQFEPERFVRLYEIDPAKVKFAFKPKEEGGLGYKEACEYLNEHCGCKIQIPDIKD